MGETTKFVIPHSMDGDRPIIRVPDGRVYTQIQNHPDRWTMEVGWIHWVGSAYCVHLNRTAGDPINFGHCRRADNDETVFTQEMMRDVRTELIKRDPQFTHGPPA